jgi:phytoene dehydrogenase-like protein
MTRTTIVGGGIAGLVAAIELAEAGAEVHVREAGPVCGGRARSEDGAYTTNRGPHALYLGGGAEAWLRGRGLMPELVHPRLTAIRLLYRDKLRRLPLALLPMLRSASAEAPVDRDYRSWATERMGARGAEAAIGFAALPTFHGDPGALSAAFIQERIQRSMARPAVGYVRGGWGALAAALSERAEAAGVEITTGDKVAELPDGPCIVATDLPAARRLLRDDALTWPGPRTAVLDVALPRRRGDCGAVLDLDRRVYVSNYAAYDASLAPEGEGLLQACAGLREGERIEDGLERIRAVLDHGYRGWRERTTFQRQGLYDGGAGVADPPGTTWRDRPAIERGGDVWLAGDRVAAPGILSEVAFESGRRAGLAAAEATLRGRGRLVAVNG